MEGLLVLDSVADSKRGRLGRGRQRKDMPGNPRSVAILCLGSASSSTVCCYLYHRTDGFGFRGEHNDSEKAIRDTAET